MRIDLESMAIELPHVAGHPNRLPFRGVLTLLDVPSDKAPAGARGHRVMLTRAAAEKALPSLLGMALDFTPNLDGHDARRKVGVITSADIVAADGKWQIANRKNRDATLRRQPVDNPTRASAWLLEISGYIFARDFPEIVELIGGRGTAESTLRQKGEGWGTRRARHVVRDCERARRRRERGGVDADRSDLHRRCHAAAQQGGVRGDLD
jgi:hypothetical protein